MQKLSLCCFRLCYVLRAHGSALNVTSMHLDYLRKKNCVKKIFVHKQCAIHIECDRIVP